MTCWVRSPPPRFTAFRLRSAWPGVFAAAFPALCDGVADENEIAVALRHAFVEGFMPLGPTAAARYGFGGRMEFFLGDGGEAKRRVVSNRIGFTCPMSNVRQAMSTKIGDGLGFRRRPLPVPVSTEGRLHILQNQITDRHEDGVINVAKRTPHARLMPMGITNCACVLFSSMVGRMPPKVVRLVRRMGWNRAPPALRTASRATAPRRV